MSAGIQWAVTAFDGFFDALVQLTTTHDVLSATELARIATLIAAAKQEGR